MLYVKGGAVKRLGAKASGKGMDRGQKKGGGGKSAYSCRTCSTDKHSWKDCYRNERYTGRRPVHIQREMDEKKNQGERAQMVSGNDEGGEETLWMIQAQGEHLEGWNLDSACTVHITPNRKLFDTYQPLAPGERTCTTATGEMVSAKGIGSIKLNCILDSNTPRRITLTGVLHTPGIMANLISVRTLASKGFTISFSENKAIVRSIKGDTVASGRVEGKHYVLNEFEADDARLVEEEKSFTSKETVCLWHNRFGHASSSNLTGISSCVDDMPTIRIRTPSVSTEAQSLGCEDCLKGKMPRTAFKPGTKKSKRPLHLLHFDLCQAKQTSFSGSKYALPIIDDYTKYREVHFVKRKSDAGQVLKDVIKRMEAHWSAEGFKVETLRCDQDAVFLSNDFTTWCRERGTSLQTTVGYTPQSNSVAENTNRVLVQRGNAMMHHAEVPSGKYWAAAIRTAAYLSNLTLTKGNGGLRTPHEMWNGAKPSVKHLRVWGCLAYAHVVKEKRKDAKFDARAMPCMLVGYTESTRIYELFDPVEEKVLKSRDIRFQEGTPYWSWRKKVQEKHDTIPVGVENDGIGFDSSDEELEDTVRHSDWMTDNDALPTKSPTTTNVANPPVTRPEPVITQPKPLKMARMLKQLNIDDNQSWTRRKTRTRRTDTDRAFPGEFPDEVHVVSTEDSAWMVADGPRTLRDALLSSDGKAWKVAIEAELENLRSHNTFHFVEDDSRLGTAITSRMVMQKKLNKLGEIEKYKVRLVAHGFKQREGLDFSKTYSPLLTHHVVRLLLSHAAAENLEIHQLDVVGAYLESPIKERIVLQLPKGLIVEDGLVKIQPSFTGDPRDEKTPPAKVILQRSLYGLKQSALNWFNYFETEAIKLDFKASSCEPGVWFKQGKEGQIIIAAWVDDILIIGKNKDVLDLKKSMCRAFKTKDMGEADTYLSLEIIRNRPYRTLTIASTAFIESTLAEFGMQDCNTVSTPLDPNVKLTYRTPSEPAAAEGTAQYQKLVGCLIYLSITTRPDLGYTAGLLGRYMHDPSEAHWLAGKRVLRFLKGTMKEALILGKRSSGEKAKHFTLFADADYAGETTTFRSTTGYVLFDPYGSAITWRSCKQPITARSTADAEFTACSIAVSDSWGITRLAGELGILPFSAPLHLLDDNSAVITNISENRGNFKPSSRHVGVHYAWLRDMGQKEEISVAQIETGKMVADTFTKPLGRLKFKRFAQDLGMQVVNKD